MIKSKAINKTALLFSVSALLISLFTSTVSLASAGQQSFNGYGYGNGGSFKSGSSPFLISPQALVVAVTVPLAGCAYFWLQSQWNNKEDLLENLKDEGSSKNSAAADRDKKVNEPEEEEKRRREKAKKSFLKERGQGGDKKYEGEKSWSLNEDERAGGAVGLVRESTDFNNQHDRFNTRGNFYGVDLSGKVKDLGSRQMPKGINKAVTTVEDGGVTIVNVKSMDGLRSLVQSAGVGEVPSAGGKAASGLTKTKKIKLTITFEDFKSSDDIDEAKEIMVRLLRENRLIGFGCDVFSDFGFSDFIEPYDDEDIQVLKMAEQYMPVFMDAFIENLEVATSLQELSFDCYHAEEIPMEHLMQNKIGDFLGVIEKTPHLKRFYFLIKDLDDTEGVFVGNYFFPTLMGYAFADGVTSFHMYKHDEVLSMEEANAVVRFLKKHPFVTRLDFRCKSIGLEEANVIISMLRKDKNIESLIFNNASEDGDYNVIDITVVRAIADMLKVNDTLKVLDIFDNLIGEEGERVLLDMLKVNMGLRQVKFSWGELGVGIALHPEDFNGVSEETIKETIKEINQLLAINCFLQKNFPRLSKAGLRKLKLAIISKLDQVFVETGERAVVEEESMMEYIEQEVGELRGIFLIDSAELAISGCEGEGVDLFAGKSQEEMAEEAAEDFLTSFDTSSDQGKRYMAQKMFHIYQALAETFTEGSVEMQEAREKSMVYLVYSYGLKLALSEAVAEKVIGVEDDVDLDMEVLLKAVVVENLRGGKGGLLYEQFLKDEETRLKAVSYLRRKIIKHDSWLTEERKRWMMGVVLHLFGEELLEEVSNFKQGDIEEIKKTLVSLNRRRESKEWDIRSVELYVKGLREQRENVAKQETREKIDNEIEKREGKIERLKQKLLTIEQKIKEVSSDVAKKEQHLEVFNALSNLSEVDGQYFEFLDILREVINREDASKKLRDVAQRLAEFADELRQN